MPPLQVGPSYPGGPPNDGATLREPHLRPAGAPLTVNTFMDNWDLKVPKLPLLTYTVATLEEAKGLVTTLPVIG